MKLDNKEYLLEKLHIKNRAFQNSILLDPDQSMWIKFSIDLFICCFFIFAFKSYKRFGQLGSVVIFSFQIIILLLTTENTFGVLNYKIFLKGIKFKGKSQTFICISRVGRISIKNFETS
jgi:hypothetical protein